MKPVAVGGSVQDRSESDRYLDVQIQLIETQLAGAFFGSWVGAALMSLIFHMVDALAFWGIWFGAYSLYLLMVYLPYHAGLVQRRFSSQERTWLMMGVMGIIGAFWGSTTWMAQSAGGDLLTLFLIGCVASGIAAAAMGFCNSCWAVSATHYLTVVPLINVGFFLHGGPQAFTFSVFSLVYLLYLLQFSKAAEVSAKLSIQLRFENTVLVERLRQQTAHADEARTQAEMAKAQAEVASMDKSRFMAAASHDLRQPIHAMGLFLEALGLTSMTHRQRGMLENAMAAWEASRSMLGTLLDYSRLDAGVVHFEPRNFAVQAILAELVREYAPQAEEKGLVFRLRDTPLAACSDPALVSLIVRNLVANAVRYTEHGGILVGVRKRGQYLVVEVWDTGVGIPAADHQRIFKEFLQLDNPERDRTKGLGLGLAIVQGLCGLIGATVSLRSEVGHGSVFRLVLPLAVGTVMDMQRLGSRHLPRVQGLRVMVIDDEQPVRDSMRQLMQMWGCECVVAASLHDAQTMVLPEPPDVVVTDYRLQHGVTGKDVIQALRERWGTDLRCVIVTGDTAPDRLREAVDTGVVLLHKPLAANQLIRAIAP
ncbi:MAG: response regulator [Hydrogenophaga sp.]|nr:response regulator [Hydrogenophaga sp.]